MKTLAQLREEVYLLINANDMDRKHYEKPLVHAVNYAMAELCGEISPIVESMRVNILRRENLFGGVKMPVVMSSADRLATFGKKAGSLLIRYVGEGEISVMKNGNRTSFELEYSPVETDFSLTFPEEAITGFEIITVSKIMLTFVGLYQSVSDPEYADEYVYYDMDELTDRKFMRFYPANAVIDVYTGEIPDGVVFRNSHTVGLRNEDGVYEIRYLIYPDMLDENASGNEIIPLDGDALSLIPLLCAWRLLKEDDERLATMYYNEYTSAKEHIALLDRLNGITVADVKGGWI